MSWTKSQIGYCSNVHAGESPEKIQENIKRYTAPLRENRDLASMQHGLWLSKQACTEYLSNTKRLTELKECLREHCLEIVTLNAFPVGNFHAECVKQGVYRPHWGESNRLEYTLMAAKILAFLLPAEQAFGTLSSLPLGYAKDWSNEIHTQALNFLCEAVLGLYKLESITGKHIQLCLEMEPGCVLQETTEIISLFKQQLPPVAKRYGLTLDQLHRYLGICFDVCHQAVMHENIHNSLLSIIEAGITIGKIQISSALRVKHPHQPQIKSWLSEFAESRYLHQVNGINNHGDTLFSDDLELALLDSKFNQFNEWRIHFHVPVHISSLGQKEIGTTSSEINSVFLFLSEHTQCHPHLELETYSWGVLPEQHRPNSDKELIQGMQAELSFIEKSLENNNLLITNNRAIDEQT